MRRGEPWGWQVRPALHPLERVCCPGNFSHNCKGQCFAFQRSSLCPALANRLASRLYFLKDDGEWTWTSHHLADSKHGFPFDFCCGWLNVFIVQHRKHNFACEMISKKQPIATGPRKRKADCGWVHFLNWGLGKVVLKFKFLAESLSPSRSRKRVCEAWRTINSHKHYCAYVCHISLFRLSQRTEK